jgi:hypothetical protein
MSSPRGPIIPTRKRTSPNIKGCATVSVQAAGQTSSRPLTRKADVQENPASDGRIRVVSRGDQAGFHAREGGQGQGDRHVELLSRGP